MSVLLHSDPYLSVEVFDIYSGFPFSRCTQVSYIEDRRLSILSVDKFEGLLNMLLCCVDEK